MASTNVIVLFSTICFWICVNASTISFNTSDSTIAPLTSKPLTMTCGLKASHRDDTSTSQTIKHLTSITITKRHEAIATIYDGTPAKAIGNLDLHVEGDVTGTSGRNAYLSVTWQHPSHTQVGQYQCEMTAITESWRTVTLTASLEIKESNEQQAKPEELCRCRTNDAEILTKIDELRKKMEEDIDQLSQAKNSQIQALETKVDQLSQAKTSEIQRLQTKVDQLSQAKNALEVKVQYLETKTVQPNQAKSSEIQALETKVDQLSQAKTSEKQALETKVDQLSQAKSSEIQALETKVDQLSQAKNALEAKITEQDSNISKLTQKANNPSSSLKKLTDLSEEVREFKIESRHIETGTFLGCGGKTGWSHGSWGYKYMTSQFKRPYPIPPKYFTSVRAWRSDTDKHVEIEVAVSTTTTTHITVECYKASDTSIIDVLHVNWITFPK